MAEHFRGREVYAGYLLLALAVVGFCTSLGISRVPVTAPDKILGILPFFHSFGFMAALWMPAVNGVGVVYHPNPLDTRVIGELVEKL